MQATKRLFMTGCNRGLGKEFVQLAAKKRPDLELHITSRNSPEQFSSEWTKTLPNHNLKCYQLDIDNSSSIEKTVLEIKSKGINFDFIVANAGRGFDFGTQPPTAALSQSYMKTNLEATIDFIKKFLPLLHPKGRLVIVSTRYAQFGNQTEHMKKILRNPHITEEEILNISKQYVEAAGKGDLRPRFSWTAYGTSKALLNAWSRFVLPKQLGQEQSLVVMHPGWCQTEMGGPQANLSAEQGGKRIFDCLWLKDIEPGKFYNKKFVSFETCE